MELKTARITVLLAPSIKEQFERICRDNDVTPSQVIRSQIRQFIAESAKKGLEVGSQGGEPLESPGGL